MLAAALLLPLAAVTSRAQTPAPATSPTAEMTKEEKQQKLAEIIARFHPKQGEVALPNGLATLKVPEQFFYLDAADSRTVLVDLWGNPPQSAEGTLGMLLPASDGKPDVRDWGAIMSYDDEGYVKDSDADKINYNDLLKQMQETMRSNNAKRQEAGYPPMELIGWAAPPRYDAQAKKLYWAKEIKFGGEADHTLNYFVRILGRRDVLNLNVVAGMEQLKEIEQAAPQILSMVNFNQGHRYADFDPKTDKVAEYGLAALVAGGILAKVGGLKMIGVMLAAAGKYLVLGGKFIVVGLVALGGFFKRLFTGRGVKTHDTPSVPPSNPGA